jgi:RimJ/RimL family protein N-acetyltransferase
VTFERTSWPQSTERLTIRPLESADLPSTFPYRADPEVARWLPRQPTSWEEYALAMDKPEVLDLTLVVLLGEEIIGDLYLRVEDAWAQVEVAEVGKGAQAELGWAFAPARHGHGYATEAVAELVRICFEDLGVRRVTAIAFSENTPSLALMERLGMRREAVYVEDSYHRDLGWLDSVGYALLADEWRARRSTAG